MFSYAQVSPLQIKPLKERDPQNSYERDPQKPHKISTSQAIKEPPTYNDWFNKDRSKPLTRYYTLAIIAIFFLIFGTVVTIVLFCKAFYKPNPTRAMMEDACQHFKNILRGLACIDPQEIKNRIYGEGYMHKSILHHRAIIKLNNTEKTYTEYEKHIGENAHPLVKGWILLALYDKCKHLPKGDTDSEYDKYINAVKSTAIDILETELTPKVGEGKYVKEYFTSLVENLQDHHEDLLGMVTLLLDHRGQLPTAETTGMIKGRENSVQTLKEQMNNIYKFLYELVQHKPYPASHDDTVEVLKNIQELANLPGEDKIIQNQILQYIKNITQQFNNICTDYKNYALFVLINSYEGWFLERYLKALNDQPGLLIKAYNPGTKVENQTK